MLERLKNHQYAKAEIIREGPTIILRSYTTNVLYYNVMDGTIECTGLYSNSTRRHISWFMSQFIDDFNYHDIKKAYLNNEKLYTKVKTY